MRDYEELVKRLREHNGWALNETLDQAADAIEELHRENESYANTINEASEILRNRLKSKWISVEDALPKNELETYWVYTSVGSQHSCRWTNNRFGLGVSDKWGWSVFDIPQYTVVTYWMPLPEPPTTTE